jgi:hypothetical protein
MARWWRNRFISKHGEEVRPVRDSSLARSFEFRGEFTVNQMGHRLEGEDCKQRVQSRKVRDCLGIRFPPLLPERWARSPEVVAM